MQQSIPKETTEVNNFPTGEPDLALGVEGTRCEAVHEAINKFVVYEKFAEMTHKYDVGNFSKLLDEYSTAEELNYIRKYLEIDPQLPQTIPSEEEKSSAERTEEISDALSSGSLPFPDEERKAFARVDLTTAAHSYKFHFV